MNTVLVFKNDDMRNVYLKTSASAAERPNVIKTIERKTGNRFMYSMTEYEYNRLMYDDAPYSRRLS